MPFNNLFAIFYIKNVKMRIFDINKSIFWISKIILVVFYVVSLLFNALYVSIPYEKKNPGERITSLPMGCTWATDWAAHWNFAV